MDENTRRLFLFVIVALLIFQIFYLWPAAQRNKQQKEQQTATTAQQTATPTTDGRPTTGTATVPGESSSPITEAPVVEEKGQEIVVQTKVYRITFTTAGAYPIRWQIIDPAYARATQSDVEEAETLKHKEIKEGEVLPVELIPEYPGLGEDREYPLMVILKEAGGRYFQAMNRRVYLVERKTETDGTQVLTFTSPETPEGLRLVKRYRFSPNQYLSNLRIELTQSSRNGSQRLAFNEPTQPGLGLVWGPGIGYPWAIGRFATSAYSVATYDTEEEEILYADPKWQKVAEGESVDRNLPGNLKWGVVESRFYMASIIANGTELFPLVRAAVKSQNVPTDPELRKDLAPPYTAEVFTKGFVLAPGETKVFDYSVYAGPKQRSLLSAIDKEHKSYDLQKVLFHKSMGIIRVLANFMLWLLNQLYQFTHNYGVSIIFLTIIMRILTQPFTHIQMKHMARTGAEMKRVKPLIDAINEKYKNDPQKRSAETWKIYREHGVNPLGMFKGCFWMLIQFPIFIALYRLLEQTIDLRGASFLWINDLTAQDALFQIPFSIPFIGNKFNLIPILMGVSQVFAQRQQSTNIDDPMQRQMLVMMPIVMTVFFYTLPSGLSLYWFVSTLWQIVFQIFVNKRVQEEAERRAHRVFEERQAAAAAGVSPVTTKKPGQKGVRERFMEYLEQKAKEAQQQQQQRDKRKK